MQWGLEILYCISPSNFAKYFHKVKPFGILASIDIVVSIKISLLEMMMTIDTRTPNGLALSFYVEIFKGIKIQPYTDRNILEDSY